MQSAGQCKSEVIDAVWSDKTRWQVHGIACIGYVGEFGFQSTLNPQIPRSTPAWDTFGFISNVVTNFCKADPC